MVYVLLDRVHHQYAMGNLHTHHHVVWQCMGGGGGACAFRKCIFPWGPCGPRPQHHHTHHSHNIDLCGGVYNNICKGYGATGPHVCTPEGPMGPMGPGPNGAHAPRGPHIYSVVYRCIYGGFSFVSL